MKKYDFDIDDLYNEYTTELKEMYNKYKKVEEDPEHILTDLYDPKRHQPYYDEVTNMLQKQGITVHELSSNLLKMLKECFNSKDSEIILEKTTSSYPSEMILKYEDVDILRFSIYNHTYKPLVDERIASVELYCCNDKEIVERYRKDLELQKTLLTDKWLVYKYVKQKRKDKNQKYRVYEKVRDICLLIFRSKKVMSNIEKVAEDTKRKIKKEEEFLESREQRLSKLKEHKEKYEDKIKKWEDYFSSIGYEQR